MATDTQISGGAGAYLMDTSGCLPGAIGEHGLAPRSLTAHLARLDKPLADLARDAETKRLALLSIVRETADIAAARTALDALSKGARTIVFFGTGGSGLGGQTLAQLAGWNIPGVADAEKMSRPRTRFYDNLDPDTLQRIFDEY